MKTDAQVKNDILAELNWDPAVNASDVGVIVQDGMVTLTGHLSSYAEKYAVERAVERIQGVKALAIEMKVRLTVVHERTDTDITWAVRRALEWNVLVPNNKIHPMVEKGWVALSGEVHWDYQRRAAERTVRDLRGVTGVTNLIKIEPKVVMCPVEKGIHDALERQTEHEAEHVQITFHDAQVTLHGKVRSWAAHTAAHHAAWSAPGVANVVNQLIVEERT